MFFLSAAVLLPAVVRAADEPYIPDKMTVYLTTPAMSRNWMLSGVKSKKDVTKLKSSNKTVAVLDTFEFNGTVYAGVTAKKAGKTTVSFTAKVNGKKKNYKCLITVKKYSLPFSTLKVGKTDAVKLLKNSYRASIPLKKALKNQKFTYKLKKGWTIRWMQYYNTGDGSGSIALKNGKQITVKSGKQIQINLVYKDGSEMDVLLYFEKK